MDSQKQADFSIFADRRKSLTKKVFHPIIKCVRRIEYAVESEFHDSAAYYEGVPDKIIVSDKIIRIFFVERNDEGKTIMTIQAIIYDKELFNSFLNTCGLQSHEELIGRKISFSGVMVFHPVHGASLRIRSLYPELFVEPNEAEMRAFLSYIQENGISEKMKNLNFPTFPLKIAVIGASTGTGIPEFLEHLGKSKFKFSVDIFEIDFRGNDIVQELISLIKKIASSINEYSAIAIVRKHGDSGGNSWFNSIELAKELLSLNIPVFLGASRTAPIINPLSSIVRLDTESPELLVAGMEILCNNYVDRIKQDFMAILGYAERSTTMFFEAVKEMESICYFASEISTKRALLLKNDIKSILNNIEKKCVAADTLCHDSNLAISAQSPQSLMRMGYAILISEKTGNIVKRPNKDETYRLETKNGNYKVVVQEKVDNPL